MKKKVYIRWGTLLISLVSLIITYTILLDKKDNITNFKIIVNQHKNQYESKTQLESSEGIRNNVKDKESNLDILIVPDVSKSVILEKL